MLHLSLLMYATYTFTVSNKWMYFSIIIIFSLWELISLLECREINSEHNEHQQMRISNDYHLFNEENERGFFFATPFIFVYLRTALVDLSVFIQFILAWPFFIVVTLSCEFCCMLLYCFLLAHLYSSLRTQWNLFRSSTSPRMIKQVRYFTRTYILNSFNEQLYFAILYAHSLLRSTYKHILN